MAGNSPVNLNTNFFFLHYQDFLHREVKIIILNDSYELQAPTIRSTTLFFHFWKDGVSTQWSTRCQREAKDVQ